jgi:hypothetical protein
MHLLNYLHLVAALLITHLFNFIKLLHGLDKLK